MKPVAVAAIVLTCASVSALASAQDAEIDAAARGSCAGIADRRDFTIRESRLIDPFWMLRGRKPSAATMDAVNGLKGKRYAFATVNAVSKQIESEAWVRDTDDALVTVGYSDIGIENCQGQQLDVTFTIMSAAASPSLSALFEWDSKDKAASDIAGVAMPRAWYQFAPEARFDDAQRLVAGARAQATWRTSRVPLARLDVKALGSTESHDLALTVSGDYDSTTGWLRRATWHVAGRDTSTPVGSAANDAHLDQRSLEGQFSGSLRPMHGIVARFGGMLDGGRLDSGLAASELPPQTKAGSDYTSVKLFAGVTARTDRHALTASYGLALGSTGNSFHGDWRKQVLDAAHTFDQPVGDHKLFEFEQRLTLGRLDTLGSSSVPVSERFFGGAGEKAVLLADDWRIRMNPVIRSIPTNRFSLTDAGAGGDRFVAYSSTTAFTAWGIPVVPRELTDDAQFNKKLDGELKASRSMLDVAYRSQDANFLAIKSRMPDVVTKIDQVGKAEAKARSTAGAALPATAFDACGDAMASSRSASAHVIADKPVSAFGWVKQMLPGGNNALADLVDACGVQLVATLKGVGVATGDLESTTKDLAQSASAIATSFAAINTNAAGTRADADMAYAVRALNVITKQLNITSISPVFVFDVAHISPSSSDLYSGTRYAVGGGLRLTLLSTVSLTTTYAVNPRRGPGESSGAFVVSLTTRNLFE